MLSSIYAKLFLNENNNSSAIRIIKKVYHQNSIPKIIILTSKKVNELFKQEAKNEQINLKLYNRVGVVAIKNEEREEIINYLKR